MPTLTDLSHTQLESGMLDDRQMIDEIERWRPSASALWFDQVQTELPAAADVLSEQFIPAWTTENGRYIATPRDAALADSFLDAYRPVRRISFGDELALSYIKHAATGRQAARLDVRLMWTVLRQPADDYTARLVIRRNSGEEAATAEAPLGVGWRPSSQWPPVFALVASHIQLPIRPDAEGGYRVLELRGTRGPLESRDRAPVRARLGIQAPDLWRSLVWTLSARERPQLPV